MTRLKVVVRVRPLSKREIQAGSVSVVAAENGDTLAVTNIKVPEQNAGDSRERVRRFTFDHCFEDCAAQGEVFGVVEKIIGQSVKQRFHSCVLAYGQSSSGKTHTMMGFENDPGLTPRLCDRVFGYLQESAVGEEVLKVTVSYLEIYNEKVKDLLAPEDVNAGRIQRKPLKIREHPRKGPYVQGLSEHQVSSASDLLVWLEHGNKRRRVAATLTNPQSSRSHSVFSVCCDGVKLNLIDLAGSERAANRCCIDLSRFKEGANINKSLVALGNVISALAEQSAKHIRGIRRRFVPYRDSVLTWLLKDTLGGNSNTVMVATVSPSNSCYSETVNTLRFGQRAKLIVLCRPSVHGEDPKEKTIRELRAEIARLREALKDLEQYPHLLPNPMNRLHGIPTVNAAPINPPPEPELEERPSFKNESNVNQELSEPVDPSPTTTDTLLPLIDVNVRKPRPTYLKRTSSVDYNLLQMDKDNPKMFGSNDSIPSASTKSVASTPEKESPSSSDKSRKSSLTSQTSLRRRSLTKAVPSLPKTIPRRTSAETANKMEKASSTESPQLKKVASRVDSIRKQPVVRPRSHIVAAVTSRLYSKIKHKEVATDTDDIETYQKEIPKELTICSNARKKLQELTKRALKAHKSRTEETQTDILSVLRVKESSTDVSDLPLVLSEVKEVGTVPIETKTVAVGCSFLHQLGNEPNQGRVNFTRSCGTQSSPEDFEQSRPVHQPMSFTKYLRDLQQDMPNSPIYTHTVNINISNNYLNGTAGVTSTSMSEDSLEQNNTNVGLPTPDLISNHNSLEPQSQIGGQASRDFVLLQETLEELNDQLTNETGILPQQSFNLDRARAVCVPKVTDEGPSVSLNPTYAPETSSKGVQNERCVPLPTFQSKSVKAERVECVNTQDETYTVTKQPHVLKSIVKENCSEEDTKFKTDVLDSLEYHLSNKKVKFSERASHEKRIVKAMSEFLEEATQLMSRIDKCTRNLFDNTYEIEVNVSEAKHLRRPVKKTRRKLERPKSAVFFSHKDSRDNFNQTDEESFCLPLNKYEILLEDTCRRLEEKIQSIPREQPRSDFRDLFVQDFNTDVEDSSLESNAVAFSDYGSLPRRTHKRYRRPACSPSAFLRQLTNMRKQIVKTSREDLMSGSCSH